MRSKETIQREIELTTKRLEYYLAEEEEMMSSGGVQQYTIGSRSLQRYQPSLAAIQETIEKLQKRLDELNAELEGRSPRKSVGVIPVDW